MSLEHPARAMKVGEDIWVLPELTTQLPGGLTGYFMRHHRDCSRASVATVLKRPYEEVPEMPRFSEVIAWATEQGLVPLPVHPHLPPPLGPEPTELWVAISEEIEDSGETHSRVARGSKVIFDPDGWVSLGADRGPAPNWPVTHGYRFQQKAK